ncbi:MAG: Phosphate-import permease protein PhnE [Firmicutes bacterium]|nr:Phosphate-import permease protein PhnE [Bacillota bacterium]
MLLTLRRHATMALSSAVILIGLRWGSAGFTGGMSQFVDGTRAMLSIFTQMFPPNLAYLGRISGELNESLLMALFGTVIALGAAVIAGWVRANASLPTSLRHVGHVLLRGVGAVHALVWAVVLVRGFGAGPISGLVVLTLYSLSSFMGTKQIATSAPAQTPAPALLEHSLACLKRNIRLSAVLGLVGAGGIGELLYANIQFQVWPNVGVILGGILIMVLTVDALCGQWRQLLAGQSFTSQQPRHRAS